MSLLFRTRRALLILILSFTLSGPMPYLDQRAVAAPPPFFRNETLLLGLNEPTGLTFTLDGRMFILQRGGVIRVALPGATQVEATPLLTLTNVNIDEGERGLVGMALHPNFATNGYLYLFYTANTPLRDRVSRFTVSGNVADPDSEVVIWQDTVDAHLWHHGGTLAFGLDGALYISVGDHFDTVFAYSHVSQRLDSYHGKILRLNADGSAPADNPFYDGAGPNLDAIWALGLRNPFRFSFDSPTGAMYIGDVGSNTDTSIEELNRGVAGANYGWPLCEGNCTVPGMTNPIFQYPHNSRDASITAGFVYRATQFPAEYRGSLFFADYAQNWIRRLTFDANGDVTGSLNFEPADGALDGPYGEIVDLKPGPDGSLFYVDIGPLGAPNAGTVRRIRYNPNQPPIITLASATPSASLTPPLTVNFEGAATDPENEAITYAWNFGDGNSASSATPSYTYTQRGRYFARLTASDGMDQSLSAPVTVTVGAPPQATITAPISGTTFRAGDVITYTGVATDADGLLSAANFSWQIVFRHNDHLHPAEGPITNTTSGALIIPVSGHDFSGNTGFEILLTVTDSDGIATTERVMVRPEKVNVTLTTSLPGLRVSLDQNTNALAPLVRDTLMGFQHTVGVTEQQLLNGVPVTFIGWTDGVTTTTRLITAPLTDTTYTAWYMFKTFLPLLRR
ncbi:MAG: PQQ-dependent sugar dehydrogenase [Anaerolineales bacterium]